jgi:NADPH-dependent 2,4-dienoyl-CoA reductase/sulfur reductase-like enzyme
MGFKTENQMAAINSWVGRGPATAVVVGAGAVGIELVQALNHRGIDVHVVDMGNTVLPNMMDSDMSVQLEDELKQMGVSVHTGRKVTGIEGRVNAEKVVLDNGDTIDLKGADGQNGLVVFAAGMVPEVELVKGSKIKVENGGIVVNDKMETTVKDVYAAGDCCQFSSAITGKVVSGKLATNAVPMARIIGYNMQGQNRTYPGFYNGAATKVGKFFAGSTGLTEKAAKDAGYELIIGYSNLTTKFPIIPGSKKKKMKLVCEKGTNLVLGAQIVSEEPVIGRIDLMTFAIQKNSTAEDLCALSYASQPHQSFYPAANLIVLAAEDVRRQI